MTSYSKLKRPLFWSRSRANAIEKKIMTLGLVHTLKSKCENCTYLIRCQGQHKSAVEKVILIFESVASFFFDGNLSDVYSKESALICTVNILGIGMVPYSHFHWASITDRPYREVGRILRLGEGEKKFLGWAFFPLIFF